MPNRPLLIILFVFITAFISPEQELNQFLKSNDSTLLNEIFTVNTGIMKLKNLGNISQIDPLDAESVVNTIKNELENVRAVRLSKQAAVIKAIEVYLTKNQEDQDKTNKASFFKRKVFYSSEKTDQSLVYEVFLELRKNNDFNQIVKQWFENLENPFYIQNISDPFDRILKNNEDICKNVKINEKGPIDFLVHGDIEKIDKLYFINIYFYSGLLKKNLAEVSFVSESKDIPSTTANKIRNILPKVFLINYASLEIETDDEETMIYIDTDYIGRNNVKVDYLVPGNYIVKLKKEGYKEKIENIKLTSFDEKKISTKIEEKEELQVVNFYIEPLGTKIFINSVYQGKSPFKKALSPGNYVISAKNDLYENHRYVFKIESISDEEKTLVFHLKSKDIKDYFNLKKTLYYVSFWNFTFSFVVTVPLLVFANQYWNIFSSGANANGGMDNYIATPQGAEYYKIYTTLWGLAFGMGAYTIIGLGWLFFALTDYLLTLEKKDFIPILDFYHNESGDSGVTVGLRYKF